ncbi:MAG: sulfotransferase family 2 domain-containing protein [Acidimicrobiales bacterium]
MILSTSRKFIFLHIHKTGGTSIVATLKPYIVPTEIILNGKEVSQVLGKHSTALMVRDNVSADVWDTYYKFAFVRHPVDRAISLYGYCARIASIQKRGLPHRLRRLYLPTKRGDPLRWPAMIAFTSTSSFSEFVRHPALANEPGMQPQVNSICDHDGHIIVDFVARFERFDDDFAKIQRTIGLPNDTAVRRNSSEAHSVGRSTLPQHDLDYLEQYFEIDFARLGYEL